MITLDALMPESVLPRMIDTPLLERRRIEIMGAIAQIGKGYPPIIQAGGCHCRLSDQGRVDITAAIHADMILHLGEIEKELKARGVDLDADLKAGG